MPQTALSTMIGAPTIDVLPDARTLSASDPETWA